MDANTRSKLEQLRHFYMSVMEASFKKLDKDQLEEMRRVLSKIIDGSMNGSKLLPLFEQVLADSGFPIERLYSIMQMFPVFKESKENVLTFCNMIANESTAIFYDTKKKASAHTIRALQGIANSAILGYGLSEHSTKGKTNNNLTGAIATTNPNTCVITTSAVGDCFFNVNNWGSSISSYLACISIKMLHMSSDVRSAEVEMGSLTGICTIMSYALEMRLRMIVEHAFTQVQMRCSLVDPHQKVIPKRLIYRTDYSLEQMRFLQDVVQVQIKNRSRSEASSTLDASTSAAAGANKNLQKLQQQELEMRNAANMAALAAIGNVVRKRVANEKAMEVFGNSAAEGDKKNKDDAGEELGNFDMKDPKVLAKLRQKKTLRNINNKILVSDVQNLLLRERMQNCYKNKYLYESLMFD